MKKDKRSTMVLLLIIVIVFTYILIVRNPFSDTITVTFDPCGGTMEQTTFEIEKHTTVEKPNDPIKVGYEFMGWKKEGTYFDFTSIPTKDITLYAEYKELIDVTDITLEKESITINVDEKTSLGYKVVPANATEDIDISISDENIINIKDGKVIGLKAGKAKIEIKTKKIKKVISIEVVPTANFVELSATSIDIVKGNSKTLTATIHPEDSFDKEVIWKSKNEDIATVTSDGKIKGISSGETYVTAETRTGIKGTCLVRVLVYPDNLRFDSTEYFVDLFNEIETVIKYEPEDANVFNIEYVSENSAIDIDYNGIVKADAFSKNGVKITATNENGKSTEAVVYTVGSGLDFSNEYVDSLIFPGYTFDLTSFGGISIYNRTTNTKGVDSSKIALTNIKVDFSEDGVNFDDNKTLSRDGSVISLKNSTLTSPKEMYMRFSATVKTNIYYSKAYKLYVEPKLTYTLNPTNTVTYGEVSGINRIDKIQGIKRNKEFEITFLFPVKSIENIDGSVVTYETDEEELISSVTIQKTVLFGQAEFTVKTSGGQEVTIQF